MDTIKDKNELNELWNKKNSMEKLVKKFYKGKRILVTGASGFKGAGYVIGSICWVQKFMELE